MGRYFKQSCSWAVQGLGCWVGAVFSSETTRCSLLCIAGVCLQPPAHPLSWNLKSSFKVDIYLIISYESSASPENPLFNQPITSGAGTLFMLSLKDFSVSAETTLFWPIWLLEEAPFCVSRYSFGALLGSPTSKCQNLGSFTGPNSTWTKFAKTGVSPWFENVKSQPVFFLVAQVFRNVQTAF